CTVGGYTFYPPNRLWRGGFCGGGCAPTLRDLPISYAVIATTNNRRRSLMEPKQFGYGDIRILEEAVRTKNLQRAICDSIDSGSGVGDADRAAILGLMTIVGELEYGLREVIGEVYPKEA
ncbi:hypothetical protein, partial [Rhodococcus koreensis]|uniref:hypothetical protein n=1 Tax=Rhodococcus koreensis TaxID=99653 RepID=UPI003671ADC5